jgi:hypothetical protein
LRFRGGDLYNYSRFKGDPRPCSAAQERRVGKCTLIAGRWAVVELRIRGRMTLGLVNSRRR